MKKIIGILALIAVLAGSYYLYSTGEWKRIEITGGGEVPLVELMTDDKQDIRQMLLDGRFKSAWQQVLIFKADSLTDLEREAVRDYLVEYLSENELPANADACEIERQKGAAFLLTTINRELPQTDVTEMIEIINMTDRVAKRIAEIGLPRDAPDENCEL